MTKRPVIFAVTFLIFTALFNPHLGAQEDRAVIFVTTTSVQDTGLLDALVDVFQKETGLIVKPIAVGTGQALEMGRLGQADLLWVHSPADEKKLVDEGYGLGRTTFMHNEFVVLGPKSDPAKAGGIKNAAGAFKKISESKALFVSRGDNSGTHKKEKAIWQAAGVAPDKDAYIEVGQGMAKTIMVANEKQGYVLADMSTYLLLKKSVDLAVVCVGDPALINYYSLILINPDKFPKVNKQGARELFDFLLSDESRKIVESFGREKFGQQLFFWDLKDTDNK
ncbi:MAG: substrate-binding domain-containing protein [Candidatus Omnitrophota bacterium]|nr:substrate-binding domain-containing protein [Candidatus Omnitrophota bacterium]